jgi:ubiquitin-conjugating enzyme (huntingtin interacting protein 2)
MRRVAKELGDIQNDAQSKIIAQPASADDITHLKASFLGPPDTPYEGGTFVVDIKIPQEYPFRPPVMKFDTKLWHPNVSSQTVCSRSPSAAFSRSLAYVQGCYLP